MCKAHVWNWWNINFISNFCFWKFKQLIKGEIKVKRNILIREAKKERRVRLFEEDCDVDCDMEKFFFC